MKTLLNGANIVVYSPNFGRYEIKNWAPGFVHSTVILSAAKEGSFGKTGQQKSDVLVHTVSY